MKTLEANLKQIIVAEAGSTFRNFVLSAVKEGMGYVKAAEQAEYATQKFIDVAVRNICGVDVIVPHSAIDAMWYSEYLGEPFVVVKEHPTFYEVSQPGVDRVGGSCILKKDCH